MGSSPAGPVRARNLPSTSLCSRSATVFTGSNPSVKAKTVFSKFFGAGAYSKLLLMHRTRRQRTVIQFARREAT